MIRRSRIQTAGGEGQNGEEVTEESQETMRPSMEVQAGVWRCYTAMQMRETATELEVF